MAEKPHELSETMDELEILKREMEIIRVGEYSQIPNNFTGVVKFPHGAEIWFQNGEWSRKDGPAITSRSNVKTWCQNGKTHRLHGPAIEHPNGDGEYYVLGYELTENQFKIFRFMWENASYEKTEGLMKIFVKLAKIKW